jgi:hypothetical protein
MSAKKSNKTRKHGRNKLGCEAYRREGREDKNAADRQARHAARVAFFKQRGEAKASP